jgi:hypothetical protein
MAGDEDVVEDTQGQAQDIDQLRQRGIEVPTGVDEDEAMHSVQQQMTDAGLECDAFEARRIVREAWDQRQ